MEATLSSMHIKIKATYFIYKHTVLYSKYGVDVYVTLGRKYILIGNLYECLFQDDNPH